VKKDGSDAVNDLSFLLLDVVEEMRLVQPSSMVQISKKTPDRFLRRALRIVKTGFGQPSIFNTDAIVQEMIRQGKSLEDARLGGASGCVEAGIFGKENYNLTGYFNLPKVLEITLHNGLDPRTGKRIGLETGDPSGFGAFEELVDAFRRQVNHFVEIKVKGNSIIERIYAEFMPTPFLSLLIDDCVARGKDYHDGGARYNTSYIQGVGVGTATDALTAIKYHVYGQKTLTMPELLDALKSDFSDREALRLRLINKTPKYGNDDDYADEVMVSVFELYYDAVNGRPNTRGGSYRINLLPTTVHVYFGKVTGATPDGRTAEEPLSEGVSPVQGSDRHGPTAVIKSVAKMDHLRTGGTLLNQKFTPQLLSTEEGIGKLAHLVRSYFKLDGHHVQFNVVTAETLREAQRQPENTATSSSEWPATAIISSTSTRAPDEIIRRTEHASF
jgi:formate C-acetyltransferase